MKKVIKQYLTFSKKDTIAAIVVVVLFALFIALPAFFPDKKKKAPVDPNLANQVAALQQQSNEKRQYKKSSDNVDDWSENYTANYNSAVVKGTLFTFNPNTLDADGWKRLGLREKTINTILNYRSKGGKFKQPEDLRKIWGLKKEEADRIIPYAQIGDNAITSSGNNYAQNKSAPPAKAMLFDANTATVEQLKSIPGIGYSLPYKIISFREKLGGFLNMLQLKETYGMTDSIFNAILPYLHVLPTEIKKLNINTATEYELNAHPYIDKTVAKAMIIYRNQHGGYKSINDVRKIVFIGEELFNKISPYLTVQNE